MLSLAVATLIMNGALSEGRRLGLAPLSAAVLDAGGNLVTFAREDGAGIARYDIAFAKAWGSIGMGFGSRELASRAEKFPAFITMLASVTGGRMAPSPGGVLILDAKNVVIGAIGVSGDLGDQDELCAIAGIAAAGLAAAPGRMS